jgi:hypothetical protein
VEGALSDGEKVESRKVPWQFGGMTGPVQCGCKQKCGVDSYFTSEIPPPQLWSHHLPRKIPILNCRQSNAKYFAFKTVESKILCI